MKIAVVGSGIAGLSCAWLLGRAFPVTLFESENRLGGHSNTVDLPPEILDGRPVDTGFIVFNRRTYPNLVALFEHLGVACEESDMSFAVSADRGRLEYSSNGLRGLFAQKRNFLSPGFHGMWNDILRFYRNVPKVLDAESGVPDDLSIGGYLAQNGYGRRFIADHLAPMAAAIWSSDRGAALDFPVKSFTRFFVNHGLLNLFDRPIWRTVTGGSRTYVARIADSFTGKIAMHTPVMRIERDAAGVTLYGKQGPLGHFDHVVLATHADTALSLLGDADDQERDVLGAFRYSENSAYLHSDPALMPRRRRAWASWNYMLEAQDAPDRPPVLSYWMNLLQNLPQEQDIFVTLNPPQEPEAARCYRRLSYSHPIFDGPAIAAQQRFGSIQGSRATWFCGAHCGYGFHEDGLSAGLAVAEAIGADVGLKRPWQVTESSPAGSAALAGHAGTGSTAASRVAA